MTQYITIKEAADLSGKSVQTIRRMIKSKKLKYRKDRTPQGFNYLIDLDSLSNKYSISKKALADSAIVDNSSTKSESITNSSRSTEASQEQSSSKVTPVDLDLRNTSKGQSEQSIQEHSAENQATASQQNTDVVPATQERAHQQIVSYEPVKEFTDTMQKLIEQHGKEKENLFRLVETFQNKVISLENKLKVESNSSKKWFKIW